MAHPGAVVINWTPEPPPNRKRWEHEIRSALAAPIGMADVEMVQVGGSWRVQSAKVGGIGIGSGMPVIPERAEMRQAVTEYLVAMGFPVLV
jgi:hypothetical protein